MNRLIAVHGTDQAQVVGVLADLRQQFRDPQPAFTSALELPGRGHQTAATAPASRTGRIRELWLVVKRIQVRRTALHAQKDHTLGFAWEVRCLGRQRMSLANARLIGSRTLLPHGGQTCKR